MRRNRERRTRTTGQTQGGVNTLRSSNGKSGQVVNTQFSLRWIRSRREAPAGPIIPRQKCHICTTSEVSNCPNQQSVKFGQQAKCQICTTDRVTNLHNKQSVKLAQQAKCPIGTISKGFNLHNKQGVTEQERGEDRLGMIGRMDSIGRIPAELVRRWPNRSLRGGIPLASQRERDHMQIRTMPAH